MIQPLGLVAVASMTIAGLAAVPLPLATATATATAPAAASSASRTIPGLGDDVVVRRDAETGQVRFIGSSDAGPVARRGVLDPDRTPVAAARAFVDRYRAEFGLSRAGGDLAVREVHPAVGGRTIVRFQQTHGGVPVLAGDLVVDVTSADAIRSARGEVSPDLDVSTRPQITAAEAAGVARQVTGKTAGVSGSLTAARPELWIYDSRLVGGARSDVVRLVWRTEVTSAERPDVRELVLVDAVTGQVQLHFNQVAHAKNRVVCDAANSSAKYPCTAPYARVEGGAASAVTDVNKAYDFAGGVYDFFMSRFNRDSIDNAGMTLIQTVRYCEAGGCPFENAFWDGEQMVYGAGMVGDDVVGHELAHGVTERSSGLLYWFHSGAINESMSDVFGELYDLTNGAGTDTAATRWLMGEDISLGVIRDMENPPAYSHPDKMSSPHYWDDTSDNGGVHINSGISNKAAFLLTDGGTFNGRTVAPLGINKVALIYYEANANILSSGSDYQDLYDALYQGCQNLLWAGTGGLTASNCAQVRNAALAVEMNKQPDAFFKGPEAPMCPSGQVPTDLFYDNMETASGNFSKWTKEAASGSTNAWAYDLDYAPSGRRTVWSGTPTESSDTSIALKTGIAIPTGKDVYLRFTHYKDFEYGWDGGVVEVSSNGGAWQPLNIQTNGYDSSISSGPLAGRMAFTGMSGVPYSSRTKLAPALGGNSLKFRFRVVTDELFTYVGWLLDDVRLYTCAVGSRPVGSATTNLLRNPGFEWDDDDNGFADFWSHNLGALRTATSKKTGRYGLLMGRSDNEKYVVSQRVPVTAGLAYQATSQVRIMTTAQSASLQLRVRFRNGAGTLLGTTVIRNFTDDTAGAWVLASRAMTAPAGATTATVELAQNGVAQARLDDVVFKRS